MLRDTLVHWDVESLTVKITVPLFEICTVIVVESIPLITSRLRSRDRLVGDVDLLCAGERPCGVLLRQTDRRQSINVGWSEGLIRFGQYVLNGARRGYSRLTEASE